MCGAHIMPYSWAEIFSHLREFLDSMIEVKQEVAASFNIRPTMATVIVVMGGNGPEIVQSRWGLIPPWWKNEKLPDKTFNARLESVTDQLAGKRGMWGNPFKSKRCLVISGGYFEWTGTRPDRRPQFIYLAGNEIHAFAGLWEFSETYGLTHTIVTTVAASNIEHLHHRMPVILQNENYGAWLSPETPPELAMEHLNDNRAGDLMSHEVSKQVNGRMNDPSNLEPVTGTL